MGLCLLSSLALQKKENKSEGIKDNNNSKNNDNKEKDWHRVIPRVTLTH